MNDMNYLSVVIKILELPQKKFLDNNIIGIEFQAQISEFQDTQIVTVTFWENLAHEISTSYRVNDYFIVEGYLSLRSKTNFSSISSKSKKIHITVLRFYPFTFKLR